MVVVVMCGRYLNQSTAKSEKKSAGVSYFFKKLRF